MSSYTDTSVLVACYCPERLSAESEKAVHRIGKPVISPLVEVEFSSAVATKVRMFELAPEDGNRVVSMFRSHLDEGRFQLVPVEARHYILARDWIARFESPLRALDAIHLAVAFTNKLPLVTADTGQARAASHLGIKCRLVN